MERRRGIAVSGHRPKFRRVVKRLGRLDLNTSGGMSYEATVRPLKQ